MIIDTTLTNDFIYRIVDDIEKAFCTDTRYFPARINFYIQKNVSALRTLKDEIHETREKMILHYGTYNSETGYCTVPNENMEQLNKEVEELMSIVQPISLYLIPLSWLDDMDFNFNQMEALMFMIREDDEDDELIEGEM